MNYRNVGRSGLLISEISLGGWLTTGGSLKDNNSIAIIVAAIERGVNFIDLSDVYAKGNAETVTGAAIKGYRRSDLVISSKVFWPMSDNPNDKGLSRKHIMESIHGSLKRLGTDYLDIYYCHRFDPNTPVDETVRAMDDLVHQGKILYWGTSVWEADQLNDAVAICREGKYYLPTVEQPRYNLLDRHIEPEIMPTCAKHGIGLTVWSPLAQGLLTGKYSSGKPADSRGSKTHFLDKDMTTENLAKVAALANIAKESGITLPQLALAWILRRPEISCAIVGATSLSQLEQNLSAVGVTLNADQIAAIDKVIA